MAASASRGKARECLVYFGYPMAYEDAALRAVHAGLAMAAATDSNYAPY